MLMAADELGLVMRKKNGVGYTVGSAVEPEGLVSSVMGVNGRIAANRKKDAKVTKELSRRSGEGGISKSISFPAKVAPPSSLRKSAAFVNQKIESVKNFAQNGKAANGRLPAKLADPAAQPSTPCSLVLKSDLVDGASVETWSDVGTRKPLRDALLEKNDDENNDEDDAISTSSSKSSRMTTERKNSGVGFSFRLEERAEKRKEFFMKLEEKTHAKQTEETNLQAKSKENQEAEIRQLRKSLTFKATPMPSFYQEPIPPKLELKKVPTTRARSPKLGRHKFSVSAAEESAEGITPCRSSRPGLDQSKSNGVATDSRVHSATAKKPTQNPHPKLPSQRSTATKHEAKSTGFKLKSTNRDKKIYKAAAVDNKSMGDSSETLETIAMVNSTIPRGLYDSGVSLNGISV